MSSDMSSSELPSLVARLSIADEDPSIVARLADHAGGMETVKAGRFFWAELLVRRWDDLSSDQMTSAVAEWCDDFDSFIVGMMAVGDRPPLEIELRFTLLTNETMNAAFYLPVHLVEVLAQFRISLSIAAL
jgi:hypothetical protein